MRDDVLAHYEKYLGPSKVIWKNNEPGAPEALLLFPARGERDFHTVATIGLSDIDVKTKKGFENYRRQEFITYLPGDWAIDLSDRKSPSTWPCLFLYFALNYIRDGSNVLCPGEVVHTEKTRPPVYFNFPFALILPPLIEDPAFFPLKTAAGEVNFSVPVLITEEECEFLKKSGERALVERLNEGEYNYFLVNPQRPCSLDTQESKEERAQYLSDLDEAMRLIEEEDKLAAKSGKPQRKPVAGRARPGPRGARQSKPSPAESPELAARKPAPTVWVVSTILAGIVFVVITRGRFMSGWSALPTAVMVWIGLPFIVHMIKPTKKVE